MVDYEKGVEIRVSDDQIAGAYWLLLSALHSDGKFVQAVGTQEDIAWPMAERFRLTSELRKACGLNKAQRNKLKLDKEPVEGEKDINGAITPDEVTDSGAVAWLESQAKQELNQVQEPAL